MRLKDRLFQAYAAMIYLFLFGPIGVVILFSFNDYQYAVFPLKGFTLKWFAIMTTGPFARAIQESLQVSVVVGAATGIIVCVLGSLAAFASVRYRFRLRSALNYLMLVPMIIPYILYACSLLIFYSLFKIPFSTWTIVVGHATVTLPFSMIIVSASLWGFDKRLEEASSDLGASPFTTFTRVTLPLVGSGILSGGLIGFLLSFNEFVIAVFTAGLGSTTLPVYMWGMWFTASLPELNVISTTIVGIVAVIFVLVVVILPKTVRFQI